MSTWHATPIARKDRTLLYLLDEILLGTNSKERHIAVVRVLQHLLHRGTIGAISTHDLDLATSRSAWPDAAAASIFAKRCTTSTPNNR